MNLTLEDLTLLIEALGTLIAEYGDRPNRTVLMERLEAERASRRADIAKHS